MREVDFVRFMSKVRTGKQEECWEWVAKSITPAGYGLIWLEGKYRVAHRVMFEHVNGALGKDWVLHKCDNPSCVNPNHLMRGDNAENMRQMWKRGRFAESSKLKAKPGSANPAAKLDEAGVKEILGHKGKLTVRATAEKFGMSPSMIQNIFTGRNWTHVRAP